VHLLHYVIGLGVLVMLIGLAPGINVRTMPGSRTRRLLEGGALFWHMVDLVWVFLFTMLYLPGARG
jgi:cytochrome c oxidase subunit 3